MVFRDMVVMSYSYIVGIVTVSRAIVHHDSETKQTSNRKRLLKVLDASGLVVGCDRKKTIGALKTQ